VLDEIKKREILAILTVGCSRRTAARYVGCAADTIVNTAQRDPAFAEQLARAEHNAEIGYIKNIQKAAKKEQYWRAAAWALERRNPEDFALRSPEVITVEQIIVEEVPVARYRKNILRRLGALKAGLRRSSKRKVPSREP
jgi:hypothetical protein